MNLHGYVRAAPAFRETVDCLRRTTGLPVITNEIGQRNADPAQTLAELSAARDEGLPIIVWYSIDSGSNARALVDTDGTPRAGGEALRDFVLAQTGGRGAPGDGGQPERAERLGWLLEPPGGHDVRLVLELGESAELSPGARDALVRLMEELYDTRCAATSSRAR